MKKIAIVFASALFLVAGAPVVQANDHYIVQNDQEQKDKKNKDKMDKDEIAVTDLPQSVQTSLRGEAYRDWNPTKAWKVQKDDGVVYKVEVTNGDETQKLKFDESGKYLASHSDDDKKRK